MNLARSILRHTRVEQRERGLASPNAEPARKFLYQFHDESKIEQAQKELPAGQVSYIPEESAALRGLAQVNKDLVQETGRRCPDQKIATVDLDATLIERSKSDVHRDLVPEWWGVLFLGAIRRDPEETHRASGEGRVEILLEIATRRNGGSHPQPRGMPHASSASALAAPPEWFHLLRSSSNGDLG